MTKAEIHAALDAAEADGRGKLLYSYAPGDGRGSRYVVQGEGIDRTYSRREVTAWLESGKGLWAFEYPESETRFSVGAEREGRYFVELEGARVSPFYGSRDAAARAAVAKERRYSEAEANR